MKKTILTISILLIILIGCGPSKEEAAAEQKRLLDSATTAGQQQLLDQQASEQARIEEEAYQEELKLYLIDLKAQLAAEKSKMNGIQQWEFGRTEDEKAQQVSDQTRVIEGLNNQIRDTEKQITT